MTEIEFPGAPAAAWIGSATEENDLRRYAATLRHRGWLIALAVVVATVAALVYVLTATPVYQATSNLLVTPVPTSPAATTTTIPGVIPQSSDPTRDVQTGANLVASISVAQAVKPALHLKGSATSILNKVTVQPVSDSDIVAVTAHAGSSRGAAALANAFAQEAVLTRTAQFHAAINADIAGLKAQLAAATPGTSAAALGPQLAVLEGLKGGPLPDMRVSASAVPPTGRSSPRATLTVAAGAVLGLVLGILGALGLEALDTTLRREEQLKRLFSLPVLARVPRQGQPQRRFSRFTRRRSAPRTPESLTPQALEAFRTLRAMALASRSVVSEPPRSFLITSASPDEGKTTTALNLAASLSASGSSVILIESDLRHPALGQALGLSSRYDISSVLTSEVELSRALVSSDRYPNLRCLLARTDSQPMVSGDPLFLPTVPMVLDEAEGMADYVVVDSPPLLAVIDALALARDVDFVLLVVRLGKTHLGRLRALGTLLAEASIEPGGIAVIGAELPGGHGDYGSYYQGGFGRPVDSPEVADRAAKSGAVSSVVGVSGVERSRRKPGANQSPGDNQAVQQARGKQPGQRARSQRD